MFSGMENTGGSKPALVTSDGKSDVRQKRIKKRNEYFFGYCIRGKGFNEYELKNFFQNVKLQKAQVRIFIEIRN